VATPPLMIAPTAFESCTEKVSFAARLRSPLIETVPTSQSMLNVLLIVIVPSSWADAVLGATATASIRAARDKRFKRFIGVFLSLGLRYDERAVPAARDRAPGRCRAGEELS
jgi:hypothetical protein